MTLYRLYLESGPKRRKTMVHALDIPGCIATGPTTDEALARTPGAIRRYLRFLHRHGEAVTLDDPIETVVVEHITEGGWLGNGDPSILFAPDREPLTSEEAERLICRLEWSRADLVDLVRGLSDEQMEAAPQPSGRPIRVVLEHVLESEFAYLAAFGKIEGLPGPGSIVKRREGGLLDWMARVRAREIERLRALDEHERSEVFIHWKQPRTARKILRRMLEHEWEHLVELQDRLANVL